MQMLHEWLSVERSKAISILISRHSSKSGLLRRNQLGELGIKGLQDLFSVLKMKHWQSYFMQLGKYKDGIEGY